MAKRNELSIGSQGSDVSALQNLLKKNGYSLAVDGIFGAKTQQAVRAYQKQMGLAVDGIVGENTWAALDKSLDNIYAPKVTTNTSTAQTNTTSTNKNTSTNKTTTYTPGTSVQQAEIMLKNQQASKPGAYQASDAVTQAQAMLQQQLASKPGAYQSQWQASLDEIMNQILNREKFSYDLNGDALYQQYKDQYTLQGQQAMMDTMGQAQAMTGGYGNSYAQTVGQQVYQGYMQQLGDIVPELYQLALDQYNREGDEMYNQYGLLADRESQDYGRYQDSLANWNTAYDQAYQQYRDEQSFDYGQYRDKVSDWNTAYDQAYQKYLNELNYDYGKYVDDRNYQHQVDRDAVADQQWQDAFQYQQDRDAVADSQWQKEFDEAKRQYDLKTAASSGSSGSSGGSGGSGGGSGGTGGSGGGSGGTGGSGGGSGSGYDNGNVSTSSIRILQKALGVTADGKWGPESQAAANKKWGTTSADKALNIYNGADTSAGRSNQFNGSTYDSAYSYAKANGFDFTYFHPMTESEWNSRRSSGSSNEAVTANSSYKEYIQSYVAYYLEEYGK